MGIARLLEELLEDVSEVAAALLSFRVRYVGLEDEHLDRFAAHDGFFCWEGGADEVSLGDLDVRLLWDGSGNSISVESGKARSN